MWRNAVLVLALDALLAGALYTVPEVQVEALTSGDIRVYIPDDDGVALFAFHANVNEQIQRQEPGTLYNETGEKTNGFWVLNFHEQVKVGDVLYYWVFVNANRAGYYKESSFKISDLRSSFKPLEGAPCTPGVSTMNGQSTCVGDTIIQDDFNSAVDSGKWVIEHRIPTYSGPDYEFNSYQNSDDVRFIKNGVLYLKPKPLQDDSEVRGVLDLRRGCTASDPKECLYRQGSAFLLPPVVSAKLRSRVSFKHGKVDVRAKLPAGDWIYPIVGLELANVTNKENSPRMWVAYSRGNGVLRGTGPDDYGSRLLFGGPVLQPTEPERSQNLATQSARVPYSDDFHVYSLEWKPAKISMYIDSILYGDIPLDSVHHPDIPDPFDKEYVLVLGVAVGGLYDFPDGFNSPNDPKPWSNGERNYILNFFEARSKWMVTWVGDESALQVDSVKVTAV